MYRSEHLMKQIIKPQQATFEYQMPNEAALQDKVNLRELGLIMSLKVARGASNQAVLITECLADTTKILSVVCKLETVQQDPEEVEPDEVRDSKKVRYIFDSPCSKRSAKAKMQMTVDVNWNIVRVQFSSPLWLDEVNLSDENLCVDQQYLLKYGAAPYEPSWREVWQMFEEYSVLDRINWLERDLNHLKYEGFHYEPQKHISWPVELAAQLRQEKYNERRQDLIAIFRRSRIIKALKIVKEKSKAQPVKSEQKEDDGDNETQYL